MGLLGALLTFAPHALYVPHLLTTVAWNLMPLEDQQIGGLLMWLPGGFVYGEISRRREARRDTAQAEAVLAVGS